MLEVQNLSKSFFGTVAVDDVSFRVGSGEILGFLGPNGAGKTTTMRMITGFLSPTAGTVTLDGIDISDRAIEAKRQLGYLPESLALYPEMRVKEYVRFRAELCGVPRREVASRTKDALATCFVDDVADLCSQMAIINEGRSRTSRRDTGSGSGWPERWSTGPRCWSSTSRPWGSIPGRSSRCGS